MVNFLSAGFQLTMDNNCHTTMLLAVIANPWLAGFMKCHPGRIVGVFVLCSICDA